MDQWRVVNHPKWKSAFRASAATVVLAAKPNWTGECIPVPQWRLNLIEAVETMTNLFDLDGANRRRDPEARKAWAAPWRLLWRRPAPGLVLLDRNTDGIETTAHAIRQLGGVALPIAGDVTDIDHLDRVFQPPSTANDGRIDILGNVAGEAKTGAAEDMALADIGATFHNLVISRY